MMIPQDSANDCDPEASYEEGLNPKRTEEPPNQFGDTPKSKCKPGKAQAGVAGG